MNRSRIAAIAASAAAVAVLLAGCGSAGTSGGGGGNQQLNQEQSVDTQQLAYVIPLPYFPYSVIRQDLVDIEAINALGMPTTIFNFVQGINHPILQCPAIGVPIAATDQLSNPTVAQWDSGDSGDSGWAVAGVGVGQQEPDGIFTGDTTGTNALCLDNSGQQYLDYNEAYTVAVTAPAYWDNASGTIKISGTPEMPVCKVQMYVLKGKKSYREVCTKPAGTPKHF